MHRLFLCHHWKTPPEFKIWTLFSSGQDKTVCKMLPLIKAHTGIYSYITRTKLSVRLSVWFERWQSSLFWISLLKGNEVGQGFSSDGSQTTSLSLFYVLKVAYVSGNTIKYVFVNSAKLVTSVFHSTPMVFLATVSLLNICFVCRTVHGWPASDMELFWLSVYVFCLFASFFLSFLLSFFRRTLPIWGALLHWNNSVLISRWSILLDLNRRLSLTRLRRVKIWANTWARSSGVSLTNAWVTRSEMGVCSL